MPPNRMTHLHVHTEYSLLDGAARLEELVWQARNLGMEALAITDHGAMYGVVDFYKTCKKYGVHPVLGCEVYVARRTRHDKSPGVDDDPYHLVLLAQDAEGYSNLIRLVSLGYLEGHYYRPRVDLELLQKHNRGLIALSGCTAGELAQRVLARDYEGAERVARAYKEMFGPDRYFLEVQDHGMAEERAVAAFAAELAPRLGLGLVATNDCHYVHRKDARAHDTLLCIQTGKTVSDPDRLRFPNDEFYLKSPQEMSELFSGLKGALENSARIAERCRVDFEFGRLLLPDYELPSGHDTHSYLRQLCQERLGRRYPSPGEKVLQRLEYELGVIKQMGFSGYFLIVWDFIEFARGQGIPVGPGRGSVAGSLVAYVLGITSIDPLKYGLLFERFLNPERHTMPDMDIDFCFERRNQVIDYVVKKYGQDCVAQIITFGTMAARAAIRDVGRALSMPFGTVDRIAKMVPFQLGMTLEKALENSPELKRAAEEDDQVAEVLDLARAVEGLPRHASVHAAGVVISNRPLIEQVPLQKTQDDAVVTQFTMEALEDLGLLKMDFLALRTLTVIHDCLRIIKATEGRELDLETLPLDDPDTYRLLARGDTLGIFQLESGWVRDVLRDLSPSRFDDLVAAVALCRPGPMERIPEFIAGKRGKPQYPHPRLEPILRETHGVMIYQEQVMQVVSELAGFSLAQADILRRAMGKKKPELIASLKEEFLRGAAERGLAPALAGEIFAAVDRFAGYGFNKSHAAAYALVAYQTAYLKAHHPPAYMAALLTSVVGAADKVAIYIEDCRRLGIKTLPPDINQSYSHFTVTPEGLRFGLAAVKNVGQGAIESILEARRREGPFASLRDFCERVDTRLLNKRAVESLVKAGAFDSLGRSRAQMLQGLDRVLEAAQDLHRRRSSGQLDLFEGQGRAAGFAGDEQLPAVEEFPPGRRLALEKEVLGFYITGHPLSGYADRLRAAGATPLERLQDLGDGARVTVGGLVSGLKRVVTRNGQTMAFVTLEDMVGSVEVLVFPKTYERCVSHLQPDAVLLVTGRVSVQEEAVKLAADEVAPLAERKRVHVYVRGVAGEGRGGEEAAAGAGAGAGEGRGGGERAGAGGERVAGVRAGEGAAAGGRGGGEGGGERAALEAVRRVLAAHRGPSQVWLHLPQGRVIEVARELWVEVDESLVSELQGILGPGAVRLEG